MTEVKRYMPAFNDKANFMCFSEAPDGHYLNSYVNYSDYEALQAELTKQVMLTAVVEAERDELFGALNDLLNDCINFNGAELTEVFMVNAAKALRKVSDER